MRVRLPFSREPAEVLFRKTLDSRLSPRPVGISGNSSRRSPILPSRESRSRKKMRPPQLPGQTRSTSFEGARDAPLLHSSAPWSRDRADGVGQIAGEPAHGAWKIGAHGRRLPVPRFRHSVFDFASRPKRGGPPHLMQLRIRRNLWAGVHLRASGQARTTR
jgi:hypothetical protein